MCAEGACAGTLISCDDEDVCTSDSCDAAEGCQYELNMEPCDDADACTSDDVCGEGTCAGTLISCDDEDVCTTDSCDAAEGCQYELNTEPCDDADACTSDDVCGEGTCAGTLISCDDEDVCTTDTCDATDGCQYALNTEPCDDEDACTSEDVCGDGVCGGAEIDCDDEDVCTTDTCDATDGCQYALNTEPCDDEDACTAGDVCGDGTCAGAEVDCDDEDVCTTDTCDTADGCQYALNAEPCDDADACTSDDVCGDGVCGGAEVDCDDSDACTTDSCESEDGCHHEDSSAECDDGNPCTADTCDATAGCLYAAADGDCDDADLCTDGDVCVDGQCEGVAMDCADDDPCTADTCDAAGLCSSEPYEGPCDDGDGCTVGDVCVDGACGGELIPGCGHGELHCIELIGCVTGACADSDDYPACIIGEGFDECANQAETAEDVALLEEYMGCASSCFGPDGVYEYACELENCLEAETACEARDQFGDGSCQSLNNCLNLCDGPLCLEQCYQQASELADLNFNKVWNCANEECNGAEDFNLCVNTSVGAGGPCEQTWLNCLIGVPQSCGDGICGGAEDCSTCAADCGACPSDGLLCLELLDCAFAPCQGLPLAEFEDCVHVSGPEGCYDAAASADEIADYEAYSECAFTCFDTEIGFDQVCLGLCTSQLDTCASGGEHGDGSCLELNECLGTCFNPVTAAECQLDCYAGATEDASLTFLGVLNCLDVFCGGTQDQGCVGAEIGPGGACSAGWSECQGLPPEPCGDGLCDPFEDCETCPFDCGECGGGGDEGQGCFEAVLCAQDLCLDAEPADYPDCVLGASLDACLLGASQEVTADYFDYTFCWLGCYDTETGLEDQDCMLANCFEQQSQCATGGVHGSGSCGALNDCFAQCGAAPDADACAAGCFQGATAAATEAYLQVSSCVADVCPDQLPECVGPALDGGECSDLWTACFEGAGAQCGDAVCDPGEGCDTCPGDCGACPGDDLLCPDIVDCVLGFGCDFADLVCLTDAINLCGESAATPQELDLAVNLGLCGLECGGPDGGVDLQCLAAQCMDQQIECQTGGAPPGDGTCLELDECIGACGDAPCIQGCYQQTSGDGAATYIVLDACVKSFCGLPLDPACIGFAVSGDGPCIDPLLACVDATPDPCGDGVCDELEGCESCPQDCGVCPQELLCLDLVTCADAFCEGVEGTFEVLECGLEAVTACASVEGIDPTEVALFEAYQECALSCLDPDGAPDLECLDAECAGAATECLSGGVFGDGTCLELNNCLGGCGGETACVQACNAQTSQEAAIEFAAINTCVQGACGDLPDALFFDCAQQTVGPNGACEDLWLACQGLEPAICGDGVCGPTESCLTCISDCGECSGADLCEDVVSCGLDACEGLTGDDKADCWFSELPGCVSPAADPMELQVAGDYLFCTLECEVDGVADPQCVSDLCDPIYAWCLSGGEFGDDLCLDFNDCLAVCEPAGSGCNRECASQASVESVLALLDLSGCIAVACDGAEDPFLCQEEVLAAGGACSEELDWCVSGPPPIGGAGAICGDLTDCAIAACEGVPDELFVECAAFEMFEGACADPDPDPDPDGIEYDLAFGYLECVQALGCYSDGQLDQVCAVEVCGFEQVTCVSGGAFGDGSCADFNSCLGMCAEPGTPACARECAQQSSPDSVLTFAALSACIETECAEVDDFNACVAIVTAPGEVCAELVDACFAPAAPGDCCETSPGPLCDDPAIVDCVCGELSDVFCCDNQWDAQCVAEAAQCGAGCDIGAVCGDSVCSSAEPQAVVVLITDDGFLPETVSASAGDTITWINESSAAQSVSAIGGAFDSGPIPVGDAFEWMAEAGSYGYISTEALGLLGFAEIGPAGDETCETCPQDCGSCANEGDCCEESPDAGCGDPDVVSCVCEVIGDVFCCEASWDVFCVNEAASCLGSCTECGDGVCEGAETCDSCPDDCSDECTHCGDGVCEGPPAPETWFVTLTGGGIVPEVLTISQGDAVSWINITDVVQTVTSSDGFFDSGDLEFNATFEFVFDAPGLYLYSSIYAPADLSGVVEVLPAGESCEGCAQDCCPE